MVVFTHGSFEVLNKHPNCCVCKLTCAIPILYSKQTHDDTAFASLWHCNEKTSLLPNWSGQTNFGSQNWYPLPILVPF